MLQVNGLDCKLMYWRPVIGKFVKLNCRETRANDIYEQCMHISSEQRGVLIWQWVHNFCSSLHWQVANRLFFSLYEKIISL